MIKILNYTDVTRLEIEVGKMLEFGWHLVGPVSTVMNNAGKICYIATMRITQ